MKYSTRFEFDSRNHDFMHWKSCQDIHRCSRHPRSQFDTCARILSDFRENFSEEPIAAIPMHAGDGMVRSGSYSEREIPGKRIISSSSRYANPWFCVVRLDMTGCWRNLRAVECNPVDIPENYSCHLPNLAQRSFMAQCLRQRSKFAGWLSTQRSSVALWITGESDQIQLNRRTAEPKHLQHAWIRMPRLGFESLHYAPRSNTSCNESYYITAFHDRTCLRPSIPLHGGIFSRIILFHVAGYSIWACFINHKPWRREVSWDYALFPWQSIFKQVGYLQGAQTASRRILERTCSLIPTTLLTIVHNLPTINHCNRIQDEGQFHGTFGFPMPANLADNSEIQNRSGIRPQIQHKPGISRELPVSVDIVNFR